MSARDPADQGTGERPRARPRRWARLATAALALTVASWAVALAAVWGAARRDEARPAAAIVVLGAAQYDGRPSPVLQARLDHAVGLWRRGLAPYVVVTGGGRAGDRTTEAAVGRRYVTSHGVPDSAVLLESEGRTTSASLRAVVALLRELGRTADLRPTAILVSDPFHMLRLGVLARRYGLTAYTSPTRTSPISANPRLAWEYLVRESFKVPFVLLTEPSDDE